MSAKIETNLGVISIDEEVIARVAGCAALDCYGIVGMAAKNMKDGFFQLLKVESLTKGIKVYVDEEENTISLDFHIIVEYGTNISAIADNIINTVKFQLEDCFEVKTDKINVFVEGVRVDS
ncbi:Asp23/Gls24 family envelope stress response protein [Lachnospiraceae bacterium NSJ-143]|nr:Asp23/Gls24 family envelope stress response protein [Lachnospiraceae bacterium NSJ-143]